MKPNTDSGDQTTAAEPTPNADLDEIQRQLGVLELLRNHLQSFDLPLSFPGGEAPEPASNADDRSAYSGMYS